MVKFLKQPLLWIFLLALLLRIYKLGDFPYGFHIDEAKVAWNSLSILKTGHDDQGNILSLYYNSFGDYRPTGLFYVTAPFIALFGRTIFATRFPVALFGALIVIPIYFIVELLETPKKKRSKKPIDSLLAGLLIAISPWQIDLSRATNEVVVSTFFALWAIYFFIKLIKSNSKKARFGLMSIITILLSYFFYHAIRFLAPGFFVFVFIYYGKQIKKIKNKVLVNLCVVSTLLLTIFFSTTKTALARFSQVSIFKGVDTIYQIERLEKENSSRNPLTLVFDNKYVVYARVFVDQYSSYFSGDFLMGTSGRPYRFATPGVGLITYIEAIILLIGATSIIRGNKNLLPLLLVLIAPLAASITSEDVPNLSRAFLMSPFLVIVESYGLSTLLNISKKLKRRAVILTFVLLAANFIYFFHMYFTHSVNHRPYFKDYSGDSPTYRNIGAKELTLQIDSLKVKYDKIIITNFPDNPYPWYAFFTGKDPKDFNKTYNVKTNTRIYGNIVFSEEKCPSDNDLVTYNKQNILMVDSWECPYKSQIENGLPLKIVGKITRPDGTEVYTFLERDFTKPLLINGVYY